MASKNEFLRQFIEMRKSIAPSPMAAAMATATPVSKKAKKLSKTQEFIEGGLQEIIEKKPGRRHVEEYFQKTCNELTAAKMA